MIRDGVLLVRVYAMICAGLGLDCLRVSMTGGIPMPEWTHGQAIYIIPGEVWSLVSFLPAAIVAAWVGSRHHALVCISAAISAITNLALGVFSADAAMGFIQSRVAFGAGLLWVAIAVMSAADWIGYRWCRWAREIVERIER
jgi:type III secretory pathway component EscS